MKAAIIFADGFEEIEAVSAVDILRRAGVEALCVGLEAMSVRGAHDINIKMDMVLENLNEAEFEAIVLPGGLPGAQNLANSVKLGEILAKFDASNKLIAAICAAPMALAAHSVLKSKFTCYKGFEADVRADKRGYESSQEVVKDENVITSRGPATAIEFALAIVKELCGDGVYKGLRDELLIDMA